MTRREFRGVVDGPRPAAAWAMSIVSSVMLWITEQLPLWVISIQCAAFAVSWATRLNPPNYRRSDIWLNVFMAGITTVTIRSALEGNPAAISLAYFTSLAQGLQLLDARPRKSEFVLVALALFQVILASNLTDSILFPPLLVLFLVTVTWTLLLHTLAMEAAEAGDPAAASQALAPDLKRMTLLATLTSLVLAGVLFVTLPRLKTNVVSSGIGFSNSLSGFSDRVELGDVGRIRKDHTVVMRVESIGSEAPAPSHAYWRGLAFDRFDGTSWSISSEKRIGDRRPVTGIGRFGVNLKSTGQGPLIGQRILREPVDAGVLFTPGSPQSIQGPFQHLERDRNGGLYLPGRGDERIRYTIWGRDSERDAVRLRADRTAAPLEPGPGGSRPTTRYLQLPDLDPRVAAQATSIVGSAPTDFERALALRDALRTQGRYTDTPPPLGDEKTSPIEAFLLGEIKGHCEYFASAMVVMARSQGLPARLVNGFAGGIPNEVGGFVEVTRADAHAWVEIHFEQAGWVRFDPTPPALRLRAGDALSLWQRVAQLGSAVELWWFQRVVDFDSADQIGALRSLWRSWRAIREGARDPQQKDWLPASPETELPGLELIPFLLGLLATGVGVFFWRRPRRSPASNVPASYQAAQRILARAGYRRDKTVSARDFVATLSPRLPEDGLAALTIITNHYLAQRFGQAAPVDLSGELSALQDAVDRVRLRNQAHIA